MNYDQIITELYARSDPKVVDYKRHKYGIQAENALGIYHKELKEMARLIPKDNSLAMQLFDSGIYEGRLLCSKIFNPKDLTDVIMEKWVVTFENWEICDSFSMGLFAKGDLAIAKIKEWTARPEEFQKRAGFATLSAYCMADKTSSNEVFEQFLPLIEREVIDDRIYVKKAVNWSLRSIGKRNRDLNKASIFCANRILEINDKTAKWIASNALKELQRPDVRISDYPRKIYRA